MQLKMRVQSLIFVILLDLTKGESWDLDDFPNPQTDHLGCGRPRPSFVCDPNKVLSTEQGDELDSQIGHLTRTVPCVCDTNCTTAHPVGLLILPHIPKFKHKKKRKLPRDGAEAFAHFLRRHSWNFGRCYDDILLFVNTNTRQIHSSLGHKAKHKIKEACNVKIVETAENLVRRGKYTESLLFILHQYQKVLQNKDNICLHQRSDYDYLQDKLAPTLNQTEPVYSAQTGEEKKKEDHIDEETDHVGIGVNKVVAYVFVPIFGIVFICALCVYLIRICHSVCCYNMDD